MIAGTSEATVSLGSLGPFLRTSRRSRCFGGKVHKCETWNCLSCLALLHSILKPYVVVQKSHANGSGHSCHTKNPPRFAIVKALPGNIRWFWHGWKVGLLNMAHSAAAVPRQPFQAMDMVAKHTAGHAEMRNMKLSATPCFLRIPFGIPPLSLWAHFARVKALTLCRRNFRCEKTQVV